MVKLLILEHQLLEMGYSLEEIKAMPVDKALKMMTIHMEAQRKKMEAITGIR